MLEREVEKHLVKTIKAIGGEIRKVQWIGRRGAPDRCVMLPDGVLYWVELKRPGGKLEAHQAREHKRLQKMGQSVRVLDTIEKIDQLFGV
jgi:hypothetical protein